MARTCAVCSHPRRLQIEQALLRGTPVRDIEGHYGTSKSTVARHRAHIAETTVRKAEARETVRTGSLLESVRTGEQRAETLYSQAQAILAAALSNEDPRTALQAIRTASAVMSEARGYLELRGELTNELGRDRAMPTMSIQIVSGGGPGDMPRISFAHQDAIDAADEGIQEIGLRQLA